ncbi:MAG TPA: hypothetical protein PK467_11830 [Candidatus Wallbacteria bacterium]|nr:hypothetical protein [Candidatus Wallbacteria bacterium]
MDISEAEGYSGDAEVSDDKIKTDNNGEFSVKFTVPMLAPAALTIKAANETRTTPEYPYSIDPIFTFYTSRNSTFSTNNDSFDRSVNYMMYVKVVTTELDKANMLTANFGVECAYHTGDNKHAVSNINLTNNNDFTYTGVFDWSAYANVHNGVWQVNFNLQDSSGKAYNPNKVINVTGTNVETQSSALSARSTLSSADCAFANNSTIYYKLQSNVVNLFDITAKTVKLGCAANWYGYGGVHAYNLTDLTNNMDETYSGSYNLGSLGALHYGMWVLNLKIQDSFPKVYDVVKELFLFSSNSELRAIVSNNKYFGSSYDIKHDGNRSDTAAATPYPIFNSNGKLYIVFNASPTFAASKVNYSSVTTSDFKLEFSEFNTFDADNYKNNPSVAEEKRGKPKTVSTALFNLANNSNGLFTAEIDLASVGVTSVRRSFDNYFRVVMRVVDTAYVTAQITTGPHQIDYANSQVPAYVDSHKPEFQYLKPLKEVFDRVNNSYESLASAAKVKLYNLLAASRRPYLDKNFINRSLENQIGLLRNIKRTAHNSKYSSACRSGDHIQCVGDSKTIKNVPRRPAGAFASLFIPEPAYAAVAYSGKYQVAHKIREWVTKGGYMFTMCCATETIDRVLACDEAGVPLNDYKFTFAFTGFDPSKDAPNAAEAIDAFDGPMTLETQIFNADSLKRPLCITQSHQKNYPAFSGTTNAFKTGFVKKTTGPYDSPVNILAYVGDTTSEVKYLGAEYGDGWFSFLGGHDPRFVSTYRLILDNVIIGSFSSNNPPNANSMSYGSLDWNNQSDGYTEDEKDYKAGILYGCGQPLFGEITTTYPGDIATTPLVDSIPYCYEEATNAAVSKLYDDDSETPRPEGEVTARTYKNYSEGSSRFVLVPLVTNYYTTGAPVYTKTQNLENTPKFIYKIVGRDKVRIKRYALFYLSDTTAHPDADPLYNEEGSLRYGEVRGKFVGYLK